MSRNFKSIAVAAALVGGLAVTSPGVASAGASTLTTTSTNAVAGTMDLVTTIQTTGMHNTLTAAIQQAQRSKMLSDPGPYTVFAPSDEAFNSLPAGTVESLLQPSNREKLQAILAYHVIPGKVMAGDIPAGMMGAKSAQGGTLNVNKGAGGVMVNDAKVVKADVVASNGIVHVIDKVLMPPM